jgi:hypothetical protein
MYGVFAPKKCPGANQILGLIDILKGRVTDQLRYAICGPNAAQRHAAIVLKTIRTGRLTGELDQTLYRVLSALDNTCRRAGINQLNHGPTAGFCI